MLLSVAVRNTPWHHIHTDVCVDIVTGSWVFRLSGATINILPTAFHSFHDGLSSLSEYSIRQGFVACYSERVAFGESLGRNQILAGEIINPPELDLDRDAAHEDVIVFRLRNGFLIESHQRSLQGAIGFFPGFDVQRGPKSQFFGELAREINFEFASPRCVVEDPDVDAVDVPPKEAPGGIPAARHTEEPEDNRHNRDDGQTPACC